MRKEQAQRLKEIMVKRKEERKKQQEIEIQELENIVTENKNGTDLSEFKVLSYI